MTFVIGLDADSTIYDLMSPWLGLYCKKYNKPPIDVSVVKEYNPHLCIGDNGSQLSEEDERNFYSVLDEPGLFEHLPLYDGAKEAVRALFDLPDTKLYIVSAPNSSQCAAEKIKAFTRDFPYITKKHIMLMHHKHHLSLDVMIDDSTDVIRKFSNKTLKLGIKQPWNANHSEYWHNLVPSYLDTVNALDRIIRIVQTFKKVKESI